MKKALSLLTLAVVLLSCASLTKTQIKTVNRFALTTQGFSAYPSKIMTGLADVRTKRGAYYANSLSNPNLHLAVLDSLYAKKIAAYKVSAKVDVTFKIIDKYAQSLALLSSDKYETKLDKQAASSGLGIDSLAKMYNTIDPANQVPTGIGAAISKLVLLDGHLYLQPKQAREIKKFMPQADTLIAVMTTNLLTFLTASTIDTLINEEAWGINENYLSFLRQTPKPTVENDFSYLDLKNDVDEIKTLREQTIKATKALRAAHKKLLDVIRKRENLKELCTELQVYSEQIEDLNATVNKINYHNQ